MPKTEEPMEVSDDKKKILVKMFSMFKRAYKDGSDQANQDVDGDELNDFFSSFMKAEIQHERGRNVDEVTESLNELKTTANSYNLIFIVFLLNRNKDSEMKLDFFDEPMPLYDVFDLVKDIETPKVFLIQADDPNLMPKDSLEKAVPVSFELDKSRLPKESIVLMSTLPQLMAQFKKAEQFVEWWQKTDRTLQKVECSVLVRAFMEEIRGAENADFKDLAEKIDTKVVKAQIVFGKHEKLAWKEGAKVYREYTLSKPFSL